MSVYNTYEKHKRYYIFQHLFGDDVKYRTSTGDWDARLEKAMLWDDHDFAIKKAKELLKQLQRFPATSKLIVVVGCVFVDVNSFFALEPVNEKCSELLASGPHAEWLCG